MRSISCCLSRPMVRGGNELQGCSHKSRLTWSSKGGKVAGLRWTVELNVALNSRVNLRKESWTPCGPSRCTLVNSWSSTTSCSNPLGIDSSLWSGISLIPVPSLRKGFFSEKFDVLVLLGVRAGLVRRVARKDPSHARGCSVWNGFQLV